MMKSKANLKNTFLPTLPISQLYFPPLSSTDKGWGLQSAHHRLFLLREGPSLLQPEVPPTGDTSCTC